MAARTYKMTGYRVRIGALMTASIGRATIRYRASVSASAGADAELLVYFVPDEVPMPPVPGYSKDGGRLGAICLPERFLAPMLGLLRNEKLVWLCIDPDEPARNEIRGARGHSTPEPEPDEGGELDR
jgi:hypothetical protein